MDEFNMDDFQSDLERLESLQNMLVDKASGKPASEEGYRELRRYFLDRSDTKDIAPRFIRTSQNLNQFWRFIKSEFAHYDEREHFIKTGFAPLVEYLGKGQTEKGEISDAEKRAYEEAVRRIEEVAEDGEKFLDLSNMGLTKVPGEIGQLTSLTELYLFGNQLTALPGEIGQLTSLTELDLGGNQLRVLPVKLGRLEELIELRLAGNPLVWPPMEIVRQGTGAVLAYLREHPEGPTWQDLEGVTWGDLKGVTWADMGGDSTSQQEVETESVEQEQTKEKPEEEDERPNKGRGYGENKEGITNRSNKDKALDHIFLQEDFVEFLKKEKGYSRNLSIKMRQNINILIG